MFLQQASYTPSFGGLGFSLVQASQSTRVVVSFPQFQQRESALSLARRAFCLLAWFIWQSSHREYLVAIRLQCKHRLSPTTS